MPLKRRAGIFLGAAAGTLFLAEAVARLSGVTDFPLYEASREFGYIPKPSQEGRFLGKNQWRFNAKSMGAKEFKPSDDEVDLLLIGDSIVFGGNPDHEDEKLGPQLGKLLKEKTWPISAGSWALRNELKYLSLHPEVIQAVDRFVFVLNARDFGEASSWSCELTHPRVRPRWAALYVFRKYVWSWESCGVPPAELLVPPGNWRKELRSFCEDPRVRGKPVAFFLYPEKEELADGRGLQDLEARGGQIMSLCGDNVGRVSVYSIARDPRWTLLLYRDGIHPSAKGTRTLAEIMAAPASTSRLGH